MKNLLHKKDSTAHAQRLLTWRNGIAILAFTMVTTVAMAQVGIGTTNPDDSAALDVTATDKGFLPPRLTTALRNSITAPALGLTVFNTDKTCLEVWVGAGWRSMCAQLVKDGIDPTTGAAFIDVYNPATGQIWMDRNLGASQVATASIDPLAYGDLYQWGRAGEGHQVRTSGTHDGDTLGKPTTFNATGSWDGLFITTAGTGVVDWLIPQNGGLWQGVSGLNNPCPSGYRVPTDPELNAERLSWAPQNAAGAFASPLKWTVAGLRNNLGTLGSADSLGRVWSSTAIGESSRNLNFGTGTGMAAARRAFGYTVRCIKD